MHSDLTYFVLTRQIHRNIGQDIDPESKLEQPETDEEINDNVPLPPVDCNSCNAETTSDTIKLATKGPCDPPPPAELQESERGDGLYRRIDTELGTPKWCCIWQQCLSQTQHYYEVHARYIPLMNGSKAINQSVKSIS